MTCFVMRLPPIQDDGDDRKLYDWAESRCSSFHIYDVRDEVDERILETRAGGVLTQEPQSLKHLQLMMGHNLKNWGIARGRTYQRGWLKIVSPAEMADQLGFTELAEAARRRANERLLQVLIPQERLRREAAKAAERLETIARGLARLNKVRLGKMKAGLSSLAKHAARWKEAERKRGLARQAALNVERVGCPLARLYYRRAELDSGEPWRVLKKRRLSNWSAAELAREQRYEADIVNEMGFEAMRRRQV